ncbi:hypothetical protein EJ04DRAFT_435303 [Polyplosphaeria fusca]|uniref:RGS domain-containing protein n=1 Tax=Polyplosphaeria fusca TaxID=682080 RepID=A0A9P4V260_9PLEO|nr:hypothetical protein EJ04DRAFT_435303 [Polyplosphaeria fusca]
MAKANLDSLGWAYIGITIAWTVALFAGMFYLHLHRHLPCLQIRRLPLVFAGLLSLHAYGAVCLVGYVIAPLAPCSAEYWLMSLYLPFGIAMFQTANSQFFYISSRQKSYAYRTSLRDSHPIEQEQADKLSSSRWRRILRGVDRPNGMTRMVVFMAIGLGVQLALAFIIFFGSKKFHPSYGFIDYTVQGTQAQVRMMCSKGWEWWPTIVWQFFWTWVYAPYMLWKSRNVRDVHGWRIQTICCCLVGLPASPLWLTGLYAPQMAPVNQYLIPPGWFAISIFFTEVFAIVFPIVQVLKTQSLQQETLDAIASWEKRNQLHFHGDGSIDSETKSGKSAIYSGTTIQTDLSSPTTTTKASFDSQKSDLLTMVGLENALRANPDPLLQFAALKDFSGENVSFLTHVAAWKQAWSLKPSTPSSNPTTHHHAQFVAATRIYASFVSLQFSEFPINVSSRRIKHLHSIFEAAATQLFRNASTSALSDSATPFDAPPPDASSTVDLQSGLNLDTLGKSNLKSALQVSDMGQDRALEAWEVHEAFGVDVFDEAEGEIKYLVLTNTWPKFVNSGYAMSGLGRDKEGEEGGRGEWWVKRMLCDRG